jgi:hypothetical protein
MRLSDIINESLEDIKASVDDIIFSFIAAEKTKISITKLSKSLSSNGLFVDNDVLSKILDEHPMVSSVSGDIATVSPSTPDAEFDSEEVVSQMAQQSV